MEVMIDIINFNVTFKSKANYIMDVTSIYKYNHFQIQSIHFTYYKSNKLKLSSN